MLILFNKPYGVLCQFTDRGDPPKRTLAEFVRVPNVYPAGRLDFDSEGLLVLTDDGALAHRLTDPRHKLAKSYVVQVEGTPDEDALERLRAGVVLNDGPTLPAEAESLAASPDWLWPRDPPVRFRKSVPDAWLRLTIREGRNRQVRRMTAAVGLPTLRLIRVRTVVRARRSRAGREPGGELSRHRRTHEPRRRCSRQLPRSLCALVYHCGHGVPGSLFRSRGDLPRSASALSRRAVRLARAQSARTRSRLGRRLRQRAGQRRAVPRFARVFATDPSASQIESAQARPNIDYRVEPGEQCSLPSGERRPRHRRAGVALVRLRAFLRRSRARAEAARRACGVGVFGLPRRRRRSMRSRIASTST